MDDESNICRKHELGIGKRLKQIRVQNKLSQNSFASMFGLAQTTYAPYELDKRTLPDEIKKQLVEKFGISLTWLITGIGDMYLNSDGIEKEGHCIYKVGDDISEIKEPLQDAILVAYDMEINDRLRVIRDHYRESQAQFCIRLSIPQQTYANYESKKRSIPDSVKVQLSKLFGINLNWLITGIGDMYLNPDETVLEKSNVYSALDNKGTESGAWVSINERLRQIRESQDESQAVFARRFGLAQQTYANYELPKKIIPDSLKNEIHEQLGIDLNWLITGYGNKHLSINEYKDCFNKENIVFIPIIKASLSADGKNDYEIDSEIPFPADRLKQYSLNELSAVEVNGDSMEPTFSDGDIVGYAKDIIKGNGLYVIDMLNELSVRRISFDNLDKTITIISDNQIYPAKTYPIDKEGLMILGKVVFWLHME